MSWSREEAEARLVQIKDMRKASVDMKGKPLYGYATRVEAIDKEIARLEAELSDG